MRRWSGGKRIRPFFVVETARLFGVKPEQAMMTAAAVECVHAYSLIHDDLPAMDDDALRRGRPTAHKAFDEATAILAGDALLTFAFDLLSRKQTHADADVRIALVAELARAAGLGGMAGGQLLDLAAEGRFGKMPKGAITEDAVIMLEAMKTGALIRAACGMGAILGKASDGARKALDFYGYALGQAFQIADDLLDLEGDPKTRRQENQERRRRRQGNLHRHSRRRRRARAARDAGGHGGSGARPNSAKRPRCCGPPRISSPSGEPERGPHGHAKESQAPPAEDLPHRCMRGRNSWSRRCSAWRWRCCCPRNGGCITRMLLGWDAGLVLYLCIVYWIIARSRAEPYPRACGARG